MATTLAPGRNANAGESGGDWLARVVQCIEKLTNERLTDEHARGLVAQGQPRPSELAAFGHDLTTRVLRELARLIVGEHGMASERVADAVLRRFRADAEGSVGRGDGLISDTAVADACGALLRNGVGELPPQALGVLYENLQSVTATTDSCDRNRGIRLKACNRVSRRGATGTFYTPRPLVDHLLDESLDPVIDAAEEDCCATLLRLRICDPACGAGHFLTAAARRIAQRIDKPFAMRDVLESCIFGVDIDSFAVELCRTILWIEGGGGDGLASALIQHIRCGHALLGAPVPVVLAASNCRAAADAWCRPHLASRSHSRAPHDQRLFHWPIEFPDLFAGDNPGFDVVVGNPPFLNQLESGTALLRAHADLLRARSGGAIRGYSDVAFAFLMLGVEIARRGGRLALVQPQSLLASRDAAGVRRVLADRAALRSLWTSQEHVFAAGVFTCAPAFELAGPRRLALRRFSTGAFLRLPDSPVDMNVLAAEATWSDLAAEAAGVPVFAFRSAGCIGDLAQATADFRDQYYGLDGYILESADLSSTQRDDFEAFPPLVTTGLIDLAHCAWGERGTRLLKKRWQAPRLDRRRMERDGLLAAWVNARLVPKILLATQTRVVEVYVDVAGRFLPCVPLITITPRQAADIWRIAAALASPVTAALALRRFGGVALSGGAIKLAARQALAMPLPCAPAHWESAVLHMREAVAASDPLQRRQSLYRMGIMSMHGFGLNAADRRGVGKWWRSRLAGP